MPLSQHDHVIQALAPDGAHDLLGALPNACHEAFDHADAWQQDPAGHHPEGSAVEQDTGTVRCRPAKREQPAIEAELGTGVWELAITETVPNFRGLGPALLTDAVSGEALRIIDSKLGPEVIVRSSLPDRNWTAYWIRGVGSASLNVHDSARIYVVALSRRNG